MGFTTSATRSPGPSKVWAPRATPRHHGLLGRREEPGRKQPLPQQGDGQGLARSAASPEFITRTWGDVIEKYVASGVPSVPLCAKSGCWTSRPYLALHRLKLIDTCAEHLLAVLEHIGGYWMLAPSLRKDNRFLPPWKEKPAKVWNAYSRPSWMIRMENWPSPSSITGVIFVSDMLVSDPKRPELPPKSLNRHSDKFSGGEKQTPFYISILACYLRAYKRHIQERYTGPSLGLVPIDEAVFEDVWRAHYRCNPGSCGTLELQGILSMSSGNWPYAISECDQVLAIHQKVDYQMDTNHSQHRSGSP